MQGQQGQARDSRDTEVLSCTLSSGTKGRFVLWKMEQGPHPAVGGCIWGSGGDLGRGREGGSELAGSRGEQRDVAGMGQGRSPLPSQPLRFILCPSLIPLQLSLGMQQSPRGQICALLIWSIN